LPEIKDPPKIRAAYLENLVDEGTGIKAKLDNYLRSLDNSFLPQLVQAIQTRNIGGNGSSSDGIDGSKVKHGTKYNVPLINSLILYIGTRALTESLHVQPNTPNSDFIPQAPMEIFRYLSLNLDAEGRYLFFNAIANQLRYPNNHTHYFSCVILLLFGEASAQEIIQEQITRVLVERLIVHRPHPWGLLITFIELIKNPRYNFWNRSFTRCAPEIERLFYQVGASISATNSNTNANPTNAGATQGGGGGGGANPAGGNPGGNVGGNPGGNPGGPNPQQPS